MTKGTDTLRFAYDAAGLPMTVTYNGTVYYYVTNIQGDVTAIVDSSGVTVVSYTYDAWGNLLNAIESMESTIGTLNPLRYRGYVYDVETGLYYLQSRYYDPEIGRFINADNTDYLGASETLLGYNLFAYCENNPVNMIDLDGHAAINVVFAIVGGIVGWKLGDYVAKKLGYNSGKKYWAIRAGVAVGGAVIGWFAASLLTKILTGYVKSNPSVIFKLVSKLGPSKFHSIMKFLGINPFSLAANGSKFIALVRLYNTNMITLGYNWAVSLYKKAISLGYQISLDKPHGEYGWHIHLIGGNGKLSNIHIQITKAAWDYLSKLIK